MLAGQTISETRETPPFSEVSISGVFSVSISQNNHYSVEVEAPENQMDDIEITVRRNVLHIEYTGRGRNLEKMAVFVSAPAFSKLSANGASTVVSENRLTGSALTVEGGGASNFTLDVETEQLTTQVSGACNVTYAGRATRHVLESAGACLVRAYELETEVTHAELSGASSARLTVNTTLVASTSGASNLSYRGLPLTKELETSGLSSITGVDDKARAQSGPEKDTVIVTIGKREVHISEGGNVRLQNRNSKYYMFRDNWTGVELGINGYLSPGNNINLDTESEYMDIRYNRSVGVNLNLFQQNLILARNRLALVTGLGVSWNNYYFVRDIILVHGQEELEHYVDDANNFSRNKLTVSHLNVPLMLEFQSPMGYGPGAFHLSAGLNVGLRLRSHIKQVYDLNGDKTKDKDFDDFYLNPFRYDATARIGWGRLNLFASYALNSMFREGKGPELVPFTIGIRLVSF